MANNVYLPPTPLVPGKLLITAITQTYPMVVTITDSIYNTYVVGQLVILTIPFPYGMQQANERTGEIVGISGTNFSLNIDARNFDAFSIPGPSLPPPTKPASLAPAGSRNSYNTVQIPFRSLTNEGN